jgi:hypothetical protein
VAEDWRSVSIERVVATAADVDAQLVPMLRNDIRPKKHEVAVWTDALIHEARSLLSVVLPLMEHEREFLERLNGNGNGDIIPELLTNDPAMQEIIRGHPGVNWKAVNVKRRLGAASAAASDDTPAP